MIYENAWKDRLFHACNLTVLSLVALSMLLPFVHLIAKSLSGESMVLAGKVFLWPNQFQWNSISYVIASAQYRTAFGNSFFLTIACTAFSLLVTFLTAYPLSKPDLKRRKFWMIYFVTTMLFSGGLIPTYILYRNLGLINRFWAIILPGLSVYNMLLVKNYLEGLPECLEESAMLDGSSNLQTLAFIYLPLSAPVLATVGLFYCIGRWNSYFAEMIYLTGKAKETLQVYLRSIVYLANLSDLEKTEEQIAMLEGVATESVIAAAVVVSTAPVLAVYPFLQRYFVKGLVVGTVKG